MDRMNNARPTVEYEAATMYVKTVVPRQVTADAENYGINRRYFSANQMIDAFIAGQQWLRDRCAQIAPLDTLTLEGSMNLLRDFLVALPEDWSLENAVKFMLEYNKELPKKGL